MIDFFISPTNNLKTLLVPNDETQMVTVQIWFRAGSSHESKEQWGLAHFLEHMFFKGTKKRPDGKIMKEVESFGGEVNAFTSFDYTCYYINAPYTHWEQALDILLDMVSDPVFKKSDVDSEKMVVYEEFKRANDNPHQFSFYHLQKNAFKGSYSHPILGTKKDILDFNPNKVKAFRKENYNINRCLLVIGGKIFANSNQEKIEKLISQYKLPQGPKVSYAPFSLKKNLDCSCHYGPTPMANLTLIIQATALTDPKAASEDLLVTSITSGESAAIVQEIVYKSSLAQHFSTSSMYFANGGVHFISFSCPIENLNKIYPIIKKHFDQLVKVGLDEEIIKRTYQQYQSMKIYEKESISSYSFPFGQYFTLTGDPHYEKVHLERAEKTHSKESAIIFEEIFSRPMFAELQLPKGSNKKETRSQLFKFLESIQVQVKKTSIKKTETKKTSTKYDNLVQEIKHTKGNILFRPNQTTPTFNMMIMLPGGLSAENKEKNGIYSLLSQLISKGHRDFPYLKWKDYLDSKSISFHGFSGKNSWGINIHAQSKDFNSIFPHLFHSLKSPLWTDQMLDHEKEMAQRSIVKFHQDPVKLCFNRFNSIIFNNHPYAMSMTGTKESLENIQTNDIKLLIDNNLSNKKSLLCLFGDIKEDELLKEVDKLSWDFSSSSLDWHKAHKKNMCRQIDLKENKRSFIQLDREQMHIMIGLQSYALGDKNLAYIKILSNFLNGPHSPLFYYIRDKLGLCYTIRAIHQTSLEGGSFGIYVATSIERAHQSLEEINNQLNIIVKKGISKKQLADTIKLMEGQMMLGLNTNDDFLQTYSANHFFGLGFDSVYKNLENIKKISIEELNIFLKAYLTRPKVEVLVGPKEC